MQIWGMLRRKVMENDPQWHKIIAGKSVLGLPYFYFITSRSVKNRE